MKKHERRKADDADPETERDEHAYEDSWYRSLKALAESRAARHHDDEEHDHEDGPSEDGPVDADADSTPS
jgi:hypothetical protein